ncbi:unnamed protein product [Sphagnum balticum]
MGYIQTSLASLHSSSFIPKRNPSLDLSASHQAEEWREEHERQMRELAAKKKEVLEIRREKEQLRERERRMNDSRTRGYRPPYMSAYYKKLVEGQSEEEDESHSRAKNERMKQFYL